MGAEDSKQEEIHLKGLGDKKDREKYLQKLQRLIYDDEIFKRKSSSENLYEDELIKLGRDVSEKTSVSNNIEKEKPLPVANCVLESQCKDELNFLTKLINSEDDVNEVEFRRQKPLFIAIKNGSIDYGSFA